MKLFCFGLGYTARCLAHELLPEKWQISGSGRSDCDIIFDGVTPLEDVEQHLGDTTHLLISIPPNKDQIDPALYHHKSDILNMPKLKWIGYLSATSVYGDHGGEWVDENTATSPTNERGTLRLEAETQWRAIDLPVHIFRLGGIYGPKRNQISAIKKNTLQKIIKSNHSFSRIHVEDICSALIASMENPSSHSVYNIVDDFPAAAADVLDFLCTELNLPLIEGISYDTATLSPVLRSFYQDNKRVRNELAKNELNWRPKFPSYIEGYRDILSKLD